MSQHIFLESPGIFFGIVRQISGISYLFVGHKKLQKQCIGCCLKVIKCVLEFSIVKMCHGSQHGDHVNHPLKYNF